MMGKKPKINNLKMLFEKEEDFSLTDAQYEKETGATLPKSIYYLKTNSALAKKAKEYGYYLEVIEKTVLLKKKRR